MKKTPKDTIDAFLDIPSPAEFDRQRRREYRQRFPMALPAQIQLLMDADDKAGYPPLHIGHAKYIMRTSAGSRSPIPTAKDFDDVAREVVKTHRRQLAREAVFAAAMDWADRFWRPRIKTVKWEDTPLARHASMRLALETIDAVLSGSAGGWPAW